MAAALSVRILNKEQPASPISGPQLPCMNMAVRMVIQCRPATISAGTTDHRITNASPPLSSRKKTSTLIAMMHIVTVGHLMGVAIHP
jgi:hypothetical protein